MSPSPSVPPRASLEYYRKQARDLLQASRRAEPEALERIRRNHPRLAPLSPEALAGTPLRLADAQWVIARECGVESWSKLKRHIERQALDFAGRAAALVEAAISGNMPKARELLAADSALPGADLFTAAVLGDAERVEAFLKRDPGSAARKGGPQEWEPLLYLAFSRFQQEPERVPGFLRSARLLLDHGANPDAHWVHSEWEGRQSALYGAMGVNGNAELGRMLLEAGADPNDNETLYHCAELADPACLKLLFQHGVRIDGTNALHRKLDYDDLEGLRLFLEHGADPNMPAAHRADRPLHWAVTNGRSTPFLELLLEYGAEIEVRNDSGLTPYQLAVRLGHTEAAEYLKRRGARDALSPVEQLLAACARADEVAARRLLDADPGLLERLGAADRGLITNLAWRGKTEAVRLMLELGWDVAAPGKGGETALHCAAWPGHAETARVILRHSPPLEQKDHQWQVSPLHWAVHGSLHARSREGGYLNPHADYPGVVEALLDAGADVTVLSPGPSGNEAVDAVLARYRRDG